jgi:hypothetical protein
MSNKNFTTDLAVYVARKSAGRQTDVTCGSAVIRPRKRRQHTRDVRHSWARKEGHRTAPSLR